MPPEAQREDGQEAVRDDSTVSESIPSAASSFASGHVIISGKNPVVLEIDIIRKIMVLQHTEYSVCCNIFYSCGQQAKRIYLHVYLPTAAEEEKCIRDAVILKVSLTIF